MKTIALIALLAAAGCSKKAPEGPSCADSINKGMDNMASKVTNRTDQPQMQDRLKSVIEKLRSTLTQRCTEDAWAPEAQACFATVGSQKDVRACEDKLTVEQRTKLSTQIREVMMAGRMPPPGHPPAGGSGDVGSGGPAAPPAGSTAPAAPAGTPAAPAAPAAPAGSAAPAGGW